MIYLDNGATTLQKPECVKEALLEAMASMGNSGRGVHDASLYAGRIIYRARESLAELLGAAAPEQVVFTANATESLNLVLVPAAGRGAVGASCKGGSRGRTAGRHPGLR